MRRTVRASVELICAIPCAVFLPLLHRGPCRIVLLYHDVSAAHRARFSKQMAYLAGKCSVVRPSEVMTASGTDARPVVALTFDDAFVSVLENALPVLREYGLPAGIFVPTGDLGRRPGWTMYSDRPEDGEVVMTDRQIAALDREGFEMASHTVLHRALPDLDDSELEAELAGSRKRLEEIVGHRIWGISYPYGECDARVRQAARKAGYEMGFTVEPSTVSGTTDRLAIGRFEVSAGETFLQFRLKIAGAYRASRYLRRVQRALRLSRRR